MKTTKILGLFAAGIALLSAIAPVSYAVPIMLDSSTQCSAGNQNSSIAIGDVIGNLGGAVECWGTFNGNDPGPSGDGFDIGGKTFNFVAKEDIPGVLSGANIGLDVAPDTGALMGTWEYDPALFSADAFVIVLKAGNSPGFGVWLFEGASASSYSGDWTVAWNKGLSHLSLYATDQSVPEPTSLALLGLGLLGLGFARRKRN